jgi:hypothetical protein
MEYKHIETLADNDGLSILIEVDGIRLWIDCWRNGNDWETDFNKNIFYLNNENDLKEKEIQEKIMNEDFEAFYFFIDEILEKYEKRG